MKGYIIIGPESSGTRITTDIFIEAGCIGGADHYQPFDVTGASLPSPDRPIVWRRSVPMGDVMPRLKNIVTIMEQAGYEPHVIVIVRDLYATARSQVHHGHSPDLSTALSAISQAMRHISDEVAELINPNIGFTILSYESFVLNPKATDWSLHLLGLPPLTAEQTERLKLGKSNPNDKWYEGSQNES